MIGVDFSYNGHNLSDFNLIMAEPESEDSYGLSREILKGETTQYRLEANHYGTKYSDVVTLNFYVLNYEKALNNETISYQELRRIQSWLTSSSIPKPLIVKYENGEPLEYHGVFTSVEPYVYFGLNGFNLEFTCSAPFAYKSQSVKTEGAQTKNVVCDTDEQAYVYPTITLTNFTGGEFCITNASDEDQEMRFTIDGAYDKYVIDCRLKRILADDTVLTLNDVGWSMENISDWNNVNTGIYKAYWLRLLPGNNDLTIEGDADCLMEFKSPIKIGGYSDV